MPDPEEPNPRFNGINLSYNLSYILAFLAFVIVPVCYIYIMNQSIDTLRSDSFRERLGNLYSDVKLDKKRNILWYIVFLSRRIIFVAITFYA